MYRMTLESTIDQPLIDVWTTWTDMTAYPEWDPREETMRLDGPFAVGTTGFSKQTGPRAGGEIAIVRVEPLRRFTVRTPLPGGALVLDHLLEPSEAGVRVIKRYDVTGPLQVLFRLHFSRGIRAEMPATFAALAAEVRRRRVAA